jgi:membrane protease YdiL (CAAX protease family)
VCSGLPTQIFIMYVLWALGMPIELPEQKLLPKAVFVVSLVDTVLVVGLVMVFLRAHRESPREVLLGQRRVLGEVLYGVALIPVIFFLVVVVMGIIIYFAPFLRNVPKNPLESLMQNPADTVVFAFVVMFAGGLREEVQRGFIIHRFDGFLGGGIVGVIVYSVLFGLGHYPQGWDASIAIACLGATWGLIYLKRRSIIAPVVSHAGFNLAQVAKALAMR